TLTPSFAPAFKLDLSDSAPQDTGQGTKTVTGVENASGTDKADTLIGNASPNRLEGLGGDDTLEGKGGDDNLRGGLGSDTVSYADAPSGVRADLTSGTAAGGDGVDTLNDVENLIGSPFADILTGSAAPNKVVGGGGTDNIRALDGDDTVDVRDGGLDG